LVNSLWTYTVTFYDRSSSWAATNITLDVDEIPLFTETCDKQINTGVIIINAKNGEYIKSNINSKKHIEVFDRIRITSGDGASGAYDRWFDVVRKIPIKSKGMGTKLKLELEGIERWTQKINYAKPHYFETAKNVLVDIIDNYNDNKGSQMPQITIGTNELPDKNTNNFDFGLNEETTFNRIYDLIDMMGASGSAGGVLDFFDVKFTTTGVNAITIDVISSGNGNGGKPTVTVSSTSINSGETDGGLEGAEGTVINAWGANNAGSLPVEYSKFRSRQIIMPTNLGSDSQFPVWDSNETPYPQGSIVQASDNLIYVSPTNNNTSNPTVSGWTQLTTESYYGGSVNSYTGSSDIEYSPWTIQKSAHWKNSGANPQANNLYWPANQSKRSAWDINVIINDSSEGESAFGVDVDMRSTSDNLYTEWLYGGTQSGKYDGLCVLVNGSLTPSGAFTGMGNKIMEYIDGDWRIKYEPQTDMLCSVYEEAKVYKYNGTTWVDVSTDPGANFCFHPYDSLTNTTSCITNGATGSQFVGNNSNSALTVKSQFNIIDGFIKSRLTDAFAGWDFADVTSGWEYYKVGAWLNLRFPFPINTYNSVSSVGNVYGGSTSTNFVPTLDTQNMHLTPNGKRGFNKGSDTEALGPLSSIDFFMKLKFFNVTLNILAITGDFKMRCGIIDLNDNVVYQDFVISHNDNWEPISLPLSGFQVYRGRKPKFLGNFITNSVYPPKGIPSVNIFRWDKVKSIVFQTQDSYDDNGRYIGGMAKWGDSGSLENYIELSIDALRFVKPLLVNSGIVSDLVIESEFLQKPEIQNYEQLRYDVLSELEKQKYEAKAYDVETTGKYDINCGDFFLFTDNEIVDESDTASDTIKLVANHIEYSITKPEDGRGGFLRRIRGARRFV
jgi:hypothetical protein